MTLRVINFADGFTSDNVPVADAIQAHIDNPTDAHDASAISYDNTDSELAADDVQAAIDEVELRLDTAETNISNHINNATDAHDASAISYVNTSSGLAAINVQAAIDEVELRLDTAQSNITTINNKIGAANGIAPLNGSSKIDATYLPSYVDDVLEYADIASLPLAGEQGKIYVTLDTNKTYRWTGSVYVEISASPVTSVNSQTGVVVLDADDIAETATRYWSKKNNVANSMPLVTNDSSQNYSVGSQWYDAINDTLYICEDATIGAAVWQPISGAGGGVGSVDIMFADTFENTDIADYTITQPLASISAVSPLQGENSLLIAHDFNPDYYIERIIPVDSKFKNKNVTFTLDVFTNAASGNLTLSVWDHTNTVQLLNSELIQPQDVDQTSAKRSFSFNIPSDANELRYRINVLFDSGKVSRVDNLVIELTQMSKLDTTIETPIITEWVDAGPITIGATTTAPTKGTIAVDKVKWRQVGEEYEVEYRYRQTTAGAAGSGDYIFQLPAGIEFDDLIPSYTTITRMDFNSQANTAIIDASGMTSGNDNGGGDITGIMKYSSNSFRVVTKVSFSSAGNISSTYNQLSNNPQSYSFNMKFKGKGLTATETQSVSLAQTVLVQESDSAFTGLGFVGNGSTNTGVIRLSGSVSNYGDALTYTSDAVLGDSWTVNKAGIYDVHASVDTSGGAGYAYYFTKNATVLTATVASTHSITSRLSNTGYSNTSNDVTQISGSDYLEVGDVIRFHCASSGVTASNGQYDVIKISYQGKLKQLNVSENQKIEIPTSELRMEGASSRGTGAETFTVKFANIAKLRGDAFEVDNSNATIITMKKKGRLSVTANVQLSNVNVGVRISKNQIVNTANPLQSETMAATQAYTAGASTSMTCEFDVNIGDKIRVNCDNNIGNSIFNSLNITFQEQEVAVSVTNVLPQFSESDSSVRVDTANGYGSTATKIRRFSNVRENLGSSIVYADSATSGSSFTINEDGVYNVSYSDSATAADYSGISKNASSLTTNLNSLATSEILALERQDISGGAFNIAWSGSLQAGDVIRAHSSGTGGGNNALVTFTISKVGKPNVTGVDVTPFAKIEYEVKQFIESLTATTTFGGTRTGVPVLNITKNTNNGLIRVDSSAANGTEFVALKRCSVEVSANGSGDSVSLLITRNSTLFTLVTPDGIIARSGVNVAGNHYSCSSSVELSAGDIIRVQRNGSTLTSINQVTITATELRDAYQVIGGGVENTYSARISSAGAITSQSYPFIDSVSKPATGSYIITLKSGFFLEAPAVSAVTISGQDVRVTAISNSSISINTFNTTTFTDADAAFSIIIQRQGSDYRTPSKAIGLPAQRIAYVKDVKAAGASSGTFTSGAWQTRILNTLTDPTGLVTSLASNQFVLPAGVYDIEASAPAYKVSRHKAKIRNTTDSLDVLSGEGSYTDSTDNTQTTAIVSGRISITSSKTFELQHRCQTSAATNGFGVDSNFAIDEVYAQVKITKIEE